MHADGIQIDIDLLDLILQAETRGEDIPEVDDPDDASLGDNDVQPTTSAGVEDSPRESTTIPDPPRKKARPPKDGETKKAARGKARFTQWRYEKRMAEREDEAERHVKKVALKVLEKITTIQVDGDLCQHAGRGAGPRGRRDGDQEEIFSVASTGFMGRLLRPTPEDLKTYTLDELKQLKMRLIEWDGV